MKNKIIKILLTISVCIYVLSMIGYAQAPDNNAYAKVLDISSLFEKGCCFEFNISGIDEYGVYIDFERYNGEFEDSAKANYEDFENINYLIDYSGNIYENVYTLKDGVARVKVDETHYGYVNADYEWIAPPIYEYAEEFYNGLGVLRNDGKAVIVDSEGNIRMELDGIVYKFHGGKALYYNPNSGKSKYSVIDTKLNITPLPELNEYSAATSLYAEEMNSDCSDDTILAFRIDENKEKCVYRLFNYEGETLCEKIIDNNKDFAGICLSNGEAIIYNYNANSGEYFLMKKNGDVLERKTGSGFSQKSGNGYFMDKYVLAGEVFDSEFEKIELDDEQISEESVSVNENTIVGKSRNISASENRKFLVDCILDEEFGYYSKAKITGDKMKVLSDQPFEEIEPDVIYKDMIPQYIPEEITVHLNNEKLIFYKPPITENDRTLVPMRAIFEELEAEVTWDNDTNTATAVKDGTTISITIDSDVMYKNGESIQLDAPARLIDDGYTFVPLRAVSEALDCVVQWNEDLQRVDITTK